MDITKKNTLYYGDNLDVLARHIGDDTVDLIYLDPPFNSNATYNVLFTEKDGDKSAAQIEAFDDTWHWGLEAEKAYAILTTEIGGNVGAVISSLRNFLGANDLMAYLVMMAIRLTQLHRVLKSSGSLYLHCDPTASHYLKLILDSIFGPDKFRNEIIWRRTGGHGKVKRYAPVHDVILFYTKTDSYIWNSPVRPYMRGHVEKAFSPDADGYKTKYSGNVLTGSGTRNGESGKVWHGFDPTKKGRHWAIPGKLIEGREQDFEGLTQHQKLDKLLELGFIKIIPGSEWPIYERSITEDDGQPLMDIWAHQPYTNGTVFGTEESIDSDVAWLGTKAGERLGYPTQKPLGLLERIIEASSNFGDTVLDPFCGCGTTIDAAERLGRHWIGIDITHLAITLIRHRLHDSFGKELREYEVHGLPTSLSGAKELASHDRYQFEWWALGLIDARPWGGEKKGADRGIDGIIYFIDNPDGQVRKILVQVKSGKVQASHIRDLKGTMEREKAEMAVYITLSPATKPMLKEAIEAGFYSPTHAPTEKYQRIQILTIEGLLDGSERLDFPRHAGLATFQKAQKHTKQRKQAKLF